MILREGFYQVYNESEFWNKLNKLDIDEQVPDYQMGCEYFSKGELVAYTHHGHVRDLMYVKGDNSNEETLKFVNTLLK